jgi:hypothetical protein
MGEYLKTAHSESRAKGEDTRDVKARNTQGNELNLSRIDGSLDRLSKLKIVAYCTITHRDVCGQRQSAYDVRVQSCDQTHVGELKRM